MQTGPALDVLRIFARLGCTSFGGPVAHIGYFRTEFVTRRRWLDERGFADLVALCQFLPGPASSQLGMAIGLLRAGPLGMLCAWLGFTLPSALAMLAAGLGVARLGIAGFGAGHGGWLRGLMLVAVAVVAQAVWGMARTLCPDRPRASLAVAAAVVALLAPSAAGQLAAIVVGALAGLFVLPRAGAQTGPELPDARVNRGVAAVALAVFALLLLLLPLAGGNGPLAVFGAFYRAGSLVFGGGHVVLPLLQEAVVPKGWVGQDAFLAGYGAVQAVPGPLFTFAAFLGAVWGGTVRGGIAGAALALVAIFLPSFLLVGGALPFWGALRHRPAAQAALRGVNAAVVGVLLAALYTPVWTSAVAGPADFAITLTAFVLLTAWAVPPWIVVALGSVAGGLAGAQ
jgi:chromate transporter